MRIKCAKDEREVILIPTVGWINSSCFYGYPVIAIAFGWLRWRAKIEIGVKKWSWEK